VLGSILKAAEKSLRGASKPLHLTLLKGGVSIARYTKELARGGQMGVEKRGSSKALDGSLVKAPEYPLVAARY